MVHASFVVSVEDIFLNFLLVTALNREFNALLLKFAAVGDINKRMTLKKEIQVPFKAPLFLGKWYGVATYFFIYTKW